MPNPDFLDQAFTRAAGAALVPGNRVRLLKDAQENYPAWLEAIASATHTVLLENYMFCEDEVGLKFQRALGERARSGIRVRVIYDWLGSFGRASAGYWRSLRATGVEVRCFNRARLSAPIGALHRDHRKMLAVDGQIGFITGLCIGRRWAGDPQRGVAPWRDTGIEVRGPALHDIEQAFAQVWAATGDALPEQERPGPQQFQPEGSVAVRIVASVPGLSAVLRIDQLIAAAARRSLWLTDAYFASIPPYVQALHAAARDGVDVRLLVPGSSDLPMLRPLSQAGYRPLLEAGVRVFEWKGSMLHAKTAVADGRWARVGSSNLNVASWVGNFELDALIEDPGFAAEMERMYLADLAQATEIVLRRRRPGLAAMSVRMRERLMPERMRKVAGAPGGVERRESLGGRRGSASRAAAGALRIGRTVGAALSEERVLAPTEARLLAAFAVVALVVAAIVVRWPLVAAVPVAVLFAWVSLTLAAKALALRRERRRRGAPRTRLARTASAGAVTEGAEDQRGRVPGESGAESEGESTDESGRLPPSARKS
ncbi:MAG TPA: phospholipase D-like domain-containing protein [Steroidobacteraceae bacterium]|nr:phospholipase D-like domain-containing protein [Steroidobacteraceae bacterium]